MPSNYCPTCLTTFHDSPTSCPNLSCGAKPPRRGWGTLLGEGDLIDRHYLVIKALAVGGAGLTYLAREIDDQDQPQPPDLAIKVLYSARDSGPFLRRLSNEAQILQDLAHPHIVECRGFVQRSGQPPYLVTLFEHGGSLAGHLERVGRVPPAVAAAILKQILQALDMAHQRGVIHRDLKPDNVLLREPTPAEQVPQVRVTDFGIAKVFGGVGGRLTKVGSFVGTPEYAAPEQFEGMAPTPATDVFAAGGLLFTLLTGQPPVQFSHRMDIEHSYEELLDQLPPQLPDLGTDPTSQSLLQAAIDHMMQTEQGDRWTISRALSHLAPLIDTAQTLPPSLELTGPGAGNRQRGPVSGLQTGDNVTYTLPPSEDGRRQATARPGEASPSGMTAAIESSGATSPQEQAPPPPPEPTSSAPPPPPEPPAERPPTEPPPQAEVAPSGGEHPSPAASSGRTAGLIGAAGLFTVVAGGVVLAGLVLAGVGWSLGWFERGPSPASPEPAPAPAPTEIKDLAGRDDPEADAEREGVQAALDEAAGDLALVCGVEGTLRAKLTLAADGSVREAAIDPAPLDPADATGCLEERLADLQLPRVIDGPVRLQVEVPLPSR